MHYPERLKHYPQRPSHDRLLWERHETDDGRAYFYCPSTGVTQWDKPPGLDDCPTIAEELEEDSKSRQASRDKPRMVSSMRSLPR